MCFPKIAQLALWLVRLWKQHIRPIRMCPLPTLYRLFGIWRGQIIANVIRVVESVSWAIRETGRNLFLHPNLLLKSWKTRYLPMACKSLNSTIWKALILKLFDSNTKEKLLVLKKCIQPRTGHILGIPDWRESHLEVKFLMPPFKRKSMLAGASRFKLFFLLMTYIFICWIKKRINWRITFTSKRTAYVACSYRQLKIKGCCWFLVKDLKFYQLWSSSKVRLDVNCMYIDATIRVH